MHQPPKTVLMPTERLLYLAKELSSAAETEDWERVARLLQQFNKLATSIRFSQADKAKLKAALAKLDAAVISTTRRKHEIHDLLSILSSDPI